MFSGFRKTLGAFLSIMGSFCFDVLRRCVLVYVDATPYYMQGNQPMSNI